MVSTYANFAGGSLVQNDGEHKGTVPLHRDQVVSYSYYASEDKLIELAGAGNRKVQKDE